MKVLWAAGTQAGIQHSGKTSATGHQDSDYDAIQGAAARAASF